LALLLKAEVGKHIDGVIDFAAERIVRAAHSAAEHQLFSDGVHPTEIGYQGSHGGHYYLYEVYRLGLWSRFCRVR
jgi:hypothetical protein